MASWSVGPHVWGCPLNFYFFFFFSNSLTVGLDGTGDETQ
jgi:hypothetical protein